MRKQKEHFRFCELNFNQNKYYIIQCLEWKRKRKRKSEEEGEVGKREDERMDIDDDMLCVLCGMGI